MANAISFSIGADNSAFKNVLNQTRAHAVVAGGKISSSFKSINAAFGGLGVATSIGGFVTATRASFDLAGQINDMSASLGISSDSFQEFTHAVEQAGGKAEDFQKGMAAIIQAQSDAESENAKLSPSFAKLGLTLQDLKTRAPDEILLRIADALKESGNDGTTTAAVMDVLGKKVALKLIPSLRDGRAEFLALGNSATIMSQESIKAMDDSSDAASNYLKTMKTTYSGLLGEIINFTKKGQLGDFANTVFGTNIFPQGKVEPANKKDPNEIPTIDVKKPLRPTFWQKPAFHLTKSLPSFTTQLPVDRMSADPMGLRVRGGSDPSTALGGLSGLRNVFTQPSITSGGPRGYAGYSAESTRARGEELAEKKAKAQQDKSKTVEGTNSILQEVKTELGHIKDRL